MGAGVWYAAASVPAAIQPRVVTILLGVVSGQLLVRKNGECLPGTPPRNGERTMPSVTCCELVEGSPTSSSFLFAGLTNPCSFAPLMPMGMALPKPPARPCVPPNHLALAFQLIQALPFPSSRSYL